VTSVTNDTASLTFTNTSLTLVFPKYSDGGIATIKMDGATIDSVDMYAGTVTYQQQKTYTVAPGAHKIDVIVSGTHNASSAGNYVYLDAFVVGVPVSFGTYEDSGAAITFAGAWGTFASGSFSGGSVKISGVTNDTASVTFNTTAVTVVFAKYSDGGIASVKIDGVTQPSIDTYSGTGAIFQQQRTYSGLAPATHTIDVIVSGSHNAGSGGNYLYIDSFIVGQPVGAGTYEDNGPDIVFAGGWGGFTNASFSGGSVKVSSVTADKASLLFTGTSITLVFPKYSDGGNATVKIDGVTQSPIDMYSGSGAMFQQQQSYSALPPGSHTIEVIVSGTKNPSSFGTFIYIDAFIVS